MNLIDILERNNFGNILYINNLMSETTIMIW